MPNNASSRRGAHRRPPRIPPRLHDAPRGEEEKEAWNPHQHQEEALHETSPLLSSPEYMRQLLLEHGIYNSHDVDVDSIISTPAFSWAFNDLSSNLIPSRTEVVSEESDDLDHSSSNDSEDEHRSEVGSPHPGKKHAAHHHRVKRSLRRRIFLLLTEPQSSIFSAFFFIVLIVSIAASNIVMMMQTSSAYSFTPESCFYCSGEDSMPYTGDDSFFYSTEFNGNGDVKCECPPEPLPGMVKIEDSLIWFFTLEWSLRVLCYEAPVSYQIKTKMGYIRQCLEYLLMPSTIIDALAIFPYYLERFDEINGFLSLRLLRLFRVFQLLRLGQYNVTFMTFTTVLQKSLLSLNILLIVLVFGAAFFGSIIFWLERGTWKYTTYTDPPSFMYMRISGDGVTEEPSPFTSIPASFWWFIVTATTVGYGDVCPTSNGGKTVGAFAMLMGVLVVAFPVSVFSDLWSKELKEQFNFVEGDEDEVMVESPVPPPVPPSSDQNSYDEFKDALSSNHDIPEQEMPELLTSSGYATTTFGFHNPIKEFVQKSRMDKQQSFRLENSEGSALQPSPSTLSTPQQQLQKRHRRVRSSDAAFSLAFQPSSPEPQSNDALMGISFLDELKTEEKRKETDGIVLTPTQLGSIQHHLSLIDESQKQIRKLLNEAAISNPTDNV